jgi:rare lipoprotein A
MNQTKLWSVVALSTTIVGIPSIGRAGTTTDKPEPPAPKGDAVNLAKLQSATANLTSGRVVTQIHAHNLAGRQAATLYVRNIPFLTFVGEAVANEGTDANPVNKASAIATKINQLVSDKVDPNQISISWKKSSESATERYIIRVGNEELVEIDGYTRLPDTTNNVGQDALQATNRLRRLMGGASPLRQIANTAPRQVTVTQQAIATQEVTQSKQPTTKPQQTAKQPQKPIKPQQAAKPQKPAAKPQKPAAKPQKPTINAKKDTSKVRATHRGMASFYGNESGGRTATGERFNPNLLTAAHRSLPFGTRVRVTNNNNGRSVVVRINDRGPFTGGRVIDVSTGAARQLGMISSGVASVKLEVLGR